jgi:hypothetical protein
MGIGNSAMATDSIPAPPFAMAAFTTAGLSFAAGAMPTPRPLSVNYDIAICILGAPASRMSSVYSSDSHRIGRYLRGQHLLWW